MTSAMPASRTMKLYNDGIIPQAELRFASSEAAYGSGKASFADMLESRRVLLEARLMCAMAEGDAGMQLARLEKAIGIDPMAAQKQEEVEHAK